MNRADACELPIQTDRPDEGGVGELIVIDVVHFQPAGLAVAQPQIGFARNPTEIERRVRARVTCVILAFMNVS